MIDGGFGLRHFIAVILSLFFVETQAQSGLCDPNVPFFSVNLSGNPNGTWVSSPPVQRVGNCCGTTAPDNCIEFSLTLDTLAVAINFQIASGAVPGGAMFYQLNCGPPASVNTPICVSGAGPHVITFCKPGNNQNTYSITSISDPTVSPDASTSEGCGVEIGSTGLNLTSIVWNSVFPGVSGQYNNYLSCTSGCETTTVTPQSGFPNFIDYQICGVPIAGVCASAALYCDTVRVYFADSISNIVTPNPASFCINNPGVLLTGTILGGYPPYTITWFNGPNGTGTPVGTGLTYNATVVGTYSMMVTDSTYPLCPAKYTNVTVTSTALPLVDAGADVTACPGGFPVPLNGTVSNATGGVWTSGGGGTFSPSNTSLTANYTPSLAEINQGFAVLTLTSTGNGACNPVTDQLIVTITDSLEVTVSPSIFCYGGVSNIAATVTGGTAPYTYLWNTGATTSFLSGVPAGTYTVTVTDNSGVSCSTTGSVNLVENSPITLITPGNSLVSCDSTVLLTISATGGTGATYSYLWSTGDTTNVITVPTGSYVVTATDSIGCSGSDTIVITSATLTLTASVSQPGPICFGTTTTLTASAVGGFGNYTYLWSGGQTSNSIVVGAGNYCVTVSDSAGCINSACAVVNEHPEIIPEITGPAIVCNGATGTLTGSATGGVPPYSYTWSQGGNTNTSQVPPGTYTLTVGDTSFMGCTGSTSFTFTQSTPINISFTKTDVSCFGGSNGQAAATASGGIAPYTYFWPHSGSISSAVFGLSAGNYSVIITDSLGCTATSIVNIGQPPPLQATLNPITGSTCFGADNGTATAVVNGGTAPYVYFWSPTGTNQQVATNLPAGVVTVFVTDAKGCQASANGLITQPTQVSGSFSTVIHAQCYNTPTGSASVNPSGGTPGYQFLWLETGATTASENGLFHGTYNVQITDNAGCQGLATVTINQPTDLVPLVTGFDHIDCFGDSTGFITVSASGSVPGYSYAWSPNVSSGTSAINIPAGNYKVVITDANGCQDSVTQLLSQPPQLLLSAASINPTCFDSCNGQVLVIPNGGTPQYSYLWSNGVTTAANVTACQGSHQVTVTDSLGCQADTSLSVVQPPQISLSFTSVSAHCFQNDGSATVTASGGTPGFSYNWQTVPVQTGPTANSLSPGNYIVTVTDQKNCPFSDTVTVGNIPGISSINMSMTGTNCYQSCDGTATAAAVGGSPPYTYSWNSGQTTSSISSLCAGEYIVQATDNFGCIFTDTIDVTEPDSMIVSTIASDDTICIGESTVLTASATGGGPGGYSYSWSGGGNTSSITVSPIVTTSYIVTATDNNGCTSEPDTFVVVVRQPIGGLTINDTAICVGKTASLYVNPTGGNGAYTYLWTPGAQSTSTINVLPSVTTTYYITVSDNCGSPNLKDSVTVTVHQLPVVTIAGDPIAGCKPLCVNFQDLTTASNGTITSWLWDFGDGNTSNDQNPVHCYYESNEFDVILEATTSFGCVSSKTFSGFVKVYSNPIAEFSFLPEEVTALNPHVFFQDLSLDAVNWQWQYGVPGSIDGSSRRNPDYYYPGPGEYCPQLIVANKEGCTDSTIKCFDIHPDWNLYIPNAFTPNGDIVNGLFSAYGTNIKDFRMRIYDRWGLLIYTANDITEGWDGTYNGLPCPIDTYVYRITFTDTKDARHVREGHVVLVR